MDDDTPWTAAKSAELYQINGWGTPYFRVSEAGRVEVVPFPDDDRKTFDLYDLVLDLEARGLDLPLLIRFSDVLADRIRHINQCFANAIQEYEYAGIYRGVFPVKVNQQRHLIDEVVEHGKPWRVGLEAGSKPELLIALSATRDPGELIICNGYKDRAYIETALLAQLFDKTVIVVLERFEELGFALEAAERTGVRPTLGVRSKLTSRGVGRWMTSAGDRAKFGLSADEIVRVVDTLAERGMLDCLQLLHFHIGSQISSITPIKNALREAATIYVELARMGAKMGYLDVGGGLAVDYDGSQTDFHASKNYTEQEYAYDVVSTLKEACDKAQITPPTIVSESGRGISAHQSVLVFEIVGESRIGAPAPPERPEADAHRILKGLYETWENIRPKNVQESLHDAQQAKDEASSLFNFGYFSLRQRAQAERLYWKCIEKILDASTRRRRMPEEIDQLRDAVASIYYGNFSVFQSAPDVWAIDQLFPIMPIHRLNEQPTARATIADLTCDSDGKIDRFIDVEDVKHALEVHELRVGERYFLGLFLNGAYQEILGDLHNLFGDTNAVHVRMEEEGYMVSAVIKGDSVQEVLGYVEYEPLRMVERVRRQAERAMRQGLITVENVKLLMKHYEDALRGYTYLTDD
ncbi:MAG: biosynthetic arginine decarboxylase [Sandaracinaceae bacterium]|nr:biosynthetic arginine decarboxylase [Sandaracinaceae bacterium]